MRTSCIIPTRDRCPMLQRALASVYAQSRPVDEIIVVDDGSTDDTARMVASLYPAVRLLRTAGIGPGLARNAGAEVAGGEVLFLLDSDDYWLAGHVEALIGHFAAGSSVAYATVRNLDLVSGGEFLVPEEGRQAEGWCFAALLRWSSVMVSGVALRAKVFGEMGGFGNSAFEDWSFFLRLAERFPFAWAGPSPTLVRILHAGSLSAHADTAVICRALDQLGQESPRYLRHGRLVRRRFTELAAWTKNQPVAWRSIQHWYQALAQAGMV